MGEEDWSLRAQAAMQREEIQLLRGAVAALRASRASATPAPRESPAPLRHAATVAIAFSLGVLVTAAALAIYRVALCP
jgi:hypothetical protein